MNTRLLPAYLLTLVNVMGFSILMPVLPFVVDDYGAEKWVYGLLLTCYSAFQFIGAPWLGALSDRVGRKPVLMISQAGTLLSWFVFIMALYLPDYQVLGLAFPLWIILFSRVLDGLTGGNVSVTNAYVSDITTAEEKNYIFAYLGGIAGLGMILGPGLGGWSASTSWGYLGTLSLASGISILALLCIFFLLKESRHPNRTGEDKQKRRSVMSSILVLRRIREIQPSPFIKRLFLAKFLFMTMMAFYIATIALFMIDLFHFNKQELGLFMLVVGIFLAFNQAFLAQKFIKRLGPLKTLYLGLILSVLGLFCITLTRNLWLYCALYYVMNLGLALCFPTFNSLISTHGNKDKMGEIMGVSESLNSLATAVFPLISASLYGAIGYPIYYFMSILPLIAFWVVWERENLR